MMNIYIVCTEIYNSYNKFVINAQLLLHHVFLHIHIVFVFLFMFNPTFQTVNDSAH